MASVVITIDGPAASGKSTVARLLAERLGASFLDTGAMYRAVTLAAMQVGVDMNAARQLLKVLESCKFEFVPEARVTVVRLNGVDVTEKIREPQVTANSRYIASAPEVRDKLVEMQRQLAAGREKVVTEGRDQGTVVFPQADLKFYLTAEVGERARRRQAELGGEGEEDFRKVLQAIEERDKTDETRGVGPLRSADDAVVVDTTDLSVEQVVEKLIGCVKESRCLRKR
jgi:cytidylate kinase